MSHHFDSAADRADGRINLCDLYAFPGAPASTTVILTVNPDAGRSSPTTFRPDALYEFALASDGGTREDIALRITFTEPDDAGQQQLRVLRADGSDARYGASGTVLGEGRTGEVFPLADRGLAWAGLAADPFAADGSALGEFLQALREGRYAPGLFTAAPGNAFAGRDVTAIVLQVPDKALVDTRLSLWARVSVLDHLPQRQVNRIGQAMFRPLFFNPPGHGGGTGCPERRIPSRRPRRLRGACPPPRGHCRPAGRATGPGRPCRAGDGGVPARRGELPAWPSGRIPPRRWQRAGARRQCLRHRRRDARREGPREQLHATASHPGIPLPVRTSAR
jgi:hypothetical protein